ncbi:MAG: hypothetical protein QXR21_02550 [Thermoplasmatales archaeon]
MKALASIIAAIAIAAVLIPTASATVIHATVNENKNVATINASSNYELFYTYPNDSEQSKLLAGTTIWFNGTAFINSSGILDLQRFVRNGSGDYMGRLHGNESNWTGSDERPGANSTIVNNTSEPQLHVINASIFYQLHVRGTNTNLTVYRNLTLNIVITNITKHVGNRTVIDMSWRAFEVQGEFMASLHGILNFDSQKKMLDYNTDINELGDLRMGDDSHLFSLNQVLGNSFYLNRNTINFNVFSVPLTQWVSHYNAATNTTFFYYNVSNSLFYNSTENINGMNYTLKIIQDPSATLSVMGKVKPISANELAVVPTSSVSPIYEYIAAVVLTILVISAIVVFIVRRRK